MRVTYSYEGLTFQIYLPPLRGQSLTMTEQFLFKSGEKRTSFEQEETFARSFHGLKATAFEKNGWVTTRRVKLEPFLKRESYLRDWGT